MYETNMYLNLIKHLNMLLLNKLSLESPPSPPPPPKHTHAPHAHEHEIARKHGSCKGVRLGPVNSLNYMHRKFICVANLSMGLFGPTALLNTMVKSPSWYTHSLPHVPIIKPSKGLSPCSTRPTLQSACP